MTAWRFEIYRDEKKWMLIEADSLRKVVRYLWREFIGGNKA